MTDNGRTKPCPISDIKINKIYDITKQYKTRSVIARVLLGGSKSGSPSETKLNRWLNNGEQFLEQHEDLADAITDAYLQAMDMVNEMHDSIKEKLKEQMPDSKEYIIETKVQERKIDLLEETCKELENSIIDQYPFQGNELEIDAYKRYIKFYRGYIRGINASSGLYVANIDKHSAGAKNAGLNLKMLELTEDSFKPKKEESKLTIKGGISLHALSLQIENQDKLQSEPSKLLEYKQLDDDDDVIDV